MPEPTYLSISFSPTESARAIRVPATFDPALALQALALPPYQGVIVVHGGAGMMEDSLLGAVQRFVDIAIAPFAQAHRVLIVDGATDIGVSQIMGKARRAINGTYPLLGVVPHNYAAYPGGPDAVGERVTLNAAHTHFILVNDAAFGMESDLMVGLLQATQRPGLALVINGGQIVLNEVRAHALLGNVLVTVKGSGRIADALAEQGNPARAALPASARLHIADLAAPEACTAILAQYLLPGCNHRPPAGFDQETVR